MECPLTGCSFVGVPQKIAPPSRCIARGARTGLYLFVQPLIPFQNCESALQNPTKDFSFGGYTISTSKDGCMDSGSMGKNPGGNSRITSTGAKQEVPATPILCSAPLLLLVSISQLRQVQLAVAEAGSYFPCFWECLEHLGFLRYAHPQGSCP